MKESHGKGRLKRRARALFIMSGVGVLLIVVAPYGLVARSARSRSDAIVVLSGSSNYVERAAWAAELWRAGRAPEIILTNDGQSAGWDERRQRNPSFTEREADELERRGVSPQAIRVVAPVVTSTHEEAVRVREYAESRGLRSVQFVTSAYHTRRARWTMERVFAGSNIELGMDAPPTGGQTPAPCCWWMSAAGWKSVPGEYVKFIYYRLRY